MKSDRTNIRAMTYKARHYIFRKKRKCIKFHFLNINSTENSRFTFH